MANTNGDSTPGMQSGPTWKYIAVGAISLLGICLVALIGSWAVVASKADEAAKNIVRLQTQYETIRQDLSDIKLMIKDNTQTRQDISRNQEDIRDLQDKEKGK